jgi:hypothetical protein
LKYCKAFQLQTVKTNIKGMRLANYRRGQYTCKDGPEKPLESPRADEDNNGESLGCAY